MQQERETFFVFNPGRTFCTALVALFFGASISRSASSTATAR